MNLHNIKFIIRVTKKCKTPWKQSYWPDDLLVKLDDTREEYFPYVFVFNPIDKIFDDYLNLTWQDKRDGLWERSISLSKKIVEEWNFIEVVKNSGFILGSSRGNTPDLISHNTSRALISMLASILKKEHNLLVTDDYEDESNSFLFDVNFILSDGRCELIDYSVHNIEQDNSYDTPLMKNHKGKREELLRPNFKMMYERE